MAALMVERLEVAGRRLCGRSKAWLPGLIQIRWSRYNPSYLEPEINKEAYCKLPEQLSEEEKAERELKTVRPIKSAPSSVSSSVFYDPVISYPSLAVGAALTGGLATSVAECHCMGGDLTPILEGILWQQSKFTSMMMMGGNKILARSLINQTLEAIKRKQLEKYYKADENERENIELNPYTIFHQALKNCEPLIGLVNISKGGRSYQVPTPLRDSRRCFLSMKWMITECRENKHRRTLMPEKLSSELLAAFHNEGPIIKKKHEMHKMAEANRAFAHFRWW